MLLTHCAAFEASHQAATSLDSRLMLETSESGICCLLVFIQMSFSCFHINSSLWIVSQVEFLHRADVDSRSSQSFIVNDKVSQHYSHFIVKQPVLSCHTGDWNHSDRGTSLPLKEPPSCSPPGREHDEEQQQIEPLEDVFDGTVNSVMRFIRVWSSRLLLDSRCFLFLCQHVDSMFLNVV